MEAADTDQLQDSFREPIQEQAVISQLQSLKPVPARQQCLAPENEDLLFLRSLLPYMTGLPLVQRLSLRAEINMAVIKAWEKRAKAGCPEVDGYGEQKSG